MPMQTLEEIVAIDLGKKSWIRIQDNVAELKMTFTAAYNSLN
jgi:hypothetical protein